MTLRQGEQAPRFAVTDVFGQRVDLMDYAGHKTMVSFYRFASCPFCNIRIQRLISHQDRFEAHGLKLISFWQSSQDSILEHVGRQEPAFPIIADPAKTIYDMYHVGSSWLGALKVMKAPGLMASALKRGFNPATADGDMNQLPADFLINPDLTIHQAYYGEHIGDHIGFEAIDRFLTREQ